MSDLGGLRIGYVPYRPDLSAPGDRRRFPWWAERRGVPFSLADPDGDYDLVVLSARADITTWVHQPLRTRLVYDLIDSYLAVPRTSPKALLRGAAKFAVRETAHLSLSYRRSIEMMCRRADAVVCSTEEQRSQIGRLSTNVHVVLDAHSELGSWRKADYRAGSPFRLVWEGLPDTVRHFEVVAPVLAQVAAERPLELHLITDLRRYRWLGRVGTQSTSRIARELFEPTFLYEWNLGLLGPIATACDLAVIPLDLEDRFAAGKPENKLLMLWRLGMPTITSATPSYKRAMKGAGLDMTCSTAEDWRIALRRYCGDETARQQAGTAGRAYVERHHSEDTLIEAWDRVVRSVV